MAGNPFNAGLERTVFLGTFIHCKSLDTLDFFYDTALFVDHLGKIVLIKQRCDRIAAEQVIESRLGWRKDHTTIYQAEDGQFFFPGFIDTHIHASQYANLGLFGKTTLMDWLKTYTFPMERSLTRFEKARKVYTRCVQRTLSHGTSTACYYGTTSVHATNSLAKLCLAHGQRAFVGRVCMDRLSPDWYRDESAETAVRDTRACIDYVNEIDPEHELVTPVLTPRFGPSCTSSLLRSLGKMQKVHNLPLQTHLSETKSEVELAADLFPQSKSYTHMYGDHGILGPKTIMAHAVHISEEEADLIKKTGTKISHCPASNTALTSGMAKIRWLLDKGIDVGLGTDVSGGYSASILDAARHAILVSRLVALEGDERAKLGHEETLFLATRGGAKVMELEDKIGGFEVGMEMDCQLIGLGKVDDEEDAGVEQDLRPVDIFGWETSDEKIAKWVFGGDDRNTLALWVKGKLVHKRAEAFQD